MADNVVVSMVFYGSDILPMLKSVLQCMVLGVPVLAA